MDDHELDRLLAAARPPRRETLDGLAAEVAIAARNAEPPHRRPARRKRAVVAGITVGVLVLAGAGSLTAYQLSVPPFQTLEPGLVRIPVAVPADFTDTEGKRWTCDAFQEYRNPTDGEVEAAAAHLQSQDWSGFGSVTYAQAVAAEQTPDATDVTGRFYDLVADRLRSEALPGSVSDDPAATGDLYSGSSISCRPGPR